LKIDIEQFYPSINHKILLDNLSELNFHRFISRRMRYLLKYEIPEFLEKCPINGKGLPMGNYLSWVLAGFYLLPLDLKLKDHS